MTTNITDSTPYAVCAPCLHTMANNCFDNATEAEVQAVQVGIQTMQSAHDMIAVDGENLGFSWSPCECCGGLAGDRYLVNGVNKRQ